MDITQNKRVPEPIKHEKQACLEMREVSSHADGRIILQVLTVLLAGREKEYGDGFLYDSIRI